MKNLTMIVLALILIGGCSDTITNHYATRLDAEADRLFDRGWLPNIIPVSAKNIITSNNLDINISEGEFQYDPIDANSFLKNLSPYTERKIDISRWQTQIVEHKKKGYEAFEYSAEGSVWIFLINKREGHVQYFML